MKKQVNFKNLEKSLKKENLPAELITPLISNLKERISEKTTNFEGLEEDIFHSVSETIKNAGKLEINPLFQNVLIDRLIEELPEAGTALRVYSQFICFGNSSISLNEYSVKVFGVSKTKEKKIKKELEEWEKKTKIRKKIPFIAKDLFAYGRAFFEKAYSPDGTIYPYYLRSKIIFPLRDDQGELKKAFQLKDEDFISVVPKYLNGFDFKVEESILKSDNFIPFNKSEILMISDDSCGDLELTPLKNIAFLWGLFDLVQQSIVTYRITRAKQLIAFFLDVTGKTATEMQETISNFKTDLRTKLSIRKSSFFGKKKKREEMEISDNLVIPIRKNSETNIKQITADKSAVSVSDLKFFLSRIQINLLISHVLNFEGTKENEYAYEAFLKAIRVYQKNIAECLEEIYLELIKSKFSGLKDLKIKILFPSPDKNEIDKLSDLLLKRAMVLSQVLTITGKTPSIDWMIEYIFKDLNSEEMDVLLKDLDSQDQKENSIFDNYFTEEENAKGEKELQNQETFEDENQETFENENQETFENENQEEIEQNEESPQEKKSSFLSSENSKTTSLLDKSFSKSSALIQEKYKNTFWEFEEEKEDSINLLNKLISKSLKFREKK